MKLHPDQPELTVQEWIEFVFMQVVWMIGIVLLVSIFVWPVLMVKQTNRLNRRDRVHDVLRKLIKEEDDDRRTELLLDMCVEHCCEDGKLGAWPGLGDRTDVRAHYFKLEANKWLEKLQEVEAEEDQCNKRHASDEYAEV